MRRCRSALLLAAALVYLSAAGSFAGAADGPQASDRIEQCGTVRSGESPIGGAEVTLQQAGDRPGAVPRTLARARSGTDGTFRLTYRRPADPRAVLYLTADSGPRPDGRAARSSAPAPAPASAPVRLTTVLGPARDLPPVVVNERTTVAAAYAMARFSDGAGIAGTAPGLQNAAAISHNLADPATGDVARLLAQPPNGAQTSTLAAFNSLADVLADCVDGQTCNALFDLARRPGGPTPRNTFEAAVGIARAPGNRVAELFALSTAEPLYLPALPTAPDAWTLALRYVGNGHELDGPGNLAFDADGNAWVTNNYEFDPDPHASVCGSGKVLKLTPTGQDAPGAPYSGGGLYGAGFGIAVDPGNNAWVANFGFQGSECATDPSPLYRSVSQFGPDGTALSPASGWTSGGVVQPQGVAADRAGNIWTANCGGRSVTLFPQGRPEQAREISPPDGDLVKPFGTAVDPAGQVWVTGNGSDNVLELSPAGEPVRSVTGGGISRPLGVASDSLGNVWVANSGILPVPCEDGTQADLAAAVTDEPRRAPGASVTMVRADGTTPDAPFTNDGLVLPWGVAVDGDDTVWVSNFGGHRLAQLCGARLSSCPPGYRTGQPISPPGTGYSSNGLERNTGVQIDPSGNVWLANNWQTVPFQTNPGGHEVVVFVGLAAPVRTPLNGAPRQP
ncbi:NHL repeat-containing protein [Kitasatospora kazusensis]